LAEHSPQSPDTPPVPDGYDGPRACDPHEFGAMLDLQNLALRTLNSRAGEPPRMPSMGLDWPHVYYPANLDNIRVMTHDGLVVSAVAIAPTTVRTGPVRLPAIPPKKSASPRPAATPTPRMTSIVQRQNPEADRSTRQG